VRSFSELQLDNCDVLEEKLTSMCKLNADPYRMGDGADGKLASKTVKLLAGLEGVDCVLLGMRRPEYVVGTLPLAFGTPPLSPQVASAALRGLHNTISMWFATDPRSRPWDVETLAFARAGQVGHSCRCVRKDMVM